MEIRLKTAEEFHSAHVTIEIRATPEEATEVSQRLFTADEVGHYQGTEAELVAGPLRRRVAELEAEAKEADRRINALTGQVKGYDHDRHTEQRRADKAQARVAELEAALARSINRENRLESEGAEEAASYRRSVAARDQLLSAATNRVQAVREILGATAVGRARDEIVTSKGAVLADAIGNALRALEG